MPLFPMCCNSSAVFSSIPVALLFGNYSIIRFNFSLSICTFIYCETSGVILSGLSVLSYKSSTYSAHHYFISFSVVSLFPSLSAMLLLQLILLVVNFFILSYAFVLCLLSNSSISLHKLS